MLQMTNSYAAELLSQFPICDSWVDEAALEPTSACAYRGGMYSHSTEKEQVLLSAELNTAFEEHRHVLDEIVKLIRFEQNRDNYHPLMVRAASARNKVLSLQKTLNCHRAEHGC